MLLRLGPGALYHEGGGKVRPGPATVTGLAYWCPSRSGRYGGDQWQVGEMVLEREALGRDGTGTRFAGVMQNS